MKTPTPVSFTRDEGTSAVSTSPVIESSASFADSAYHTRGKKVRIPWIAVVISAGLHAGILLAFNHRAPPPAAVVDEETAIAVNITPPPLEEPEPAETLSDGPSQEIDAGAYVPTQADLPSSASIDSAFVQTIDYASLVPRIDKGDSRVVSIPTTGVRGSGKSMGQGLKNVFNLSDLDRAPEPRFQPPPIFPPQLKREVAQARVVVDFVVDTEGRAVEATVVESSIAGFEEAAISGVSRWLFRPGVKNGKKVNVRMRVPLMFRVNES